MPATTAPRLAPLRRFASLLRPAPAEPIDTLGDTCPGAFDDNPLHTTCTMQQPATIPVTASDLSPQRSGAYIGTKHVISAAASAAAAAAAARAASAAGAAAATKADQARWEGFERGERAGYLEGNRYGIMTGFCWGVVLGAVATVAALQLGLLWAGA